MVDPLRATPARLLEAEVVDGCRVLGKPDIDWQDGSEDEIYRRVIAAGDLSSSSDELAETARTWPEHYHLSTARANVVRSFPFAPEQRVLEVGAGCGAVTRWLGERCRVVDALEPVSARARVLRARTRDLDSVEVFVGAVTDLPAEAAYDVVVVIGVLEYVGSGSVDQAPYVDFLRELRTRLRPGGRLLLAIENKLGVKYLAGAPEDHTNRVFDSVEGYPVGSPARTFSRVELSGLMRAAGFGRCDVYGAFPDYKLPRVVYADRLAELDPDLLRRLPSMPSPDWVVPRPELVDEARLWWSLVEAGLATEVSNSFVVVAGEVDAEPFWPASTVATYFSMGRTAPYVMRCEVRKRDDGLVIERRPENPDRVGVDWLALRPGTEPVVQGAALVDAATDGDREALLGLLRRWLDTLRGLERPETHLDAVPHNAMLADGDLVVVDDEWMSQRGTVEQVVGRGLFYLVRAVERCAGWAQLWQDRSVADIMTELAGGLGVGIDESWVETEADIQGIVLQDFGGDGRAGRLAALHAELAAPVRRHGAGLRVFERFSAVSAEVEVARTQLAALHAEVAAAREVADQLTEERDALLADPWLRVGARYRSLVASVAPDGSRRRQAYAAAQRRRHPPG